MTVRYDSPFSSQFIRAEILIRSRWFLIRRSISQRYNFSCNPRRRNRLGFFGEISLESSSPLVNQVITARFGTVACEAVAALGMRSDSASYIATISWLPACIWINMLINNRPKSQDQYKRADHNVCLFSHPHHVRNERDLCNRGSQKLLTLLSHFLTATLSVGLTAKGALEHTSALIQHDLSLANATQIPPKCSIHRKKNMPGIQTKASCLDWGSWFAFNYHGILQRRRRWLFGVRV